MTERAGTQRVKKTRQISNLGDCIETNFEKIGSGNKTSHHQRKSSMSFCDGWTSPGGQNFSTTKFSFCKELEGQTTSPMPFKLATEERSHSRLRSE